MTFKKEEVREGESDVKEGRSNLLPYKATLGLSGSSCNEEKCFMQGAGKHAFGTVDWDHGL